MSPLLWVGMIVFYIFIKKSPPKGTNLDIFSPPTVDASGGSTVVTSNGTVIQGATINIARAKSISSSLWEELNDVFTSEPTIIKILKGLNASDFILVYDQFGLKDRSFLGAEGGYFGSQNNLIEWINFEVTDEKNKTVLQKQFPTIF